ncbi:MAG: restriction endonuclease subunit S [Oscillospiraceae bacterium]|nr:restriction endonuclease subunit S [Oscillospiraceae bacterium]
MRYEEYKDIGLPWYPNGIPSHWKVLRHKNVLTEHKEYVGDKSANYTLLSLTLNGVIIRDLSEGKGKFSKDYDKYVVVNEGDFVFCLFDVDETPRTVGLSSHHGMITGAYDVFTPHGINSDYFFYYYLTLDNAKALKPLYSGLRKVIPFPSFMANKFPVPPREEQDQIVRYLDWKVSRINKLIHGYQRQIKLLEERRVTEIDQVLTHGIRPDRELIITTAAWMGKVPVEWMPYRMKHLFCEVNVRSLDGSEPHLTMSQKWGLITDDMVTEKRLVSENYIGAKVCEKDDLVLNRLKAHLGVFALAPCTGVVSPDYTVLRLNTKRIIPKFAEYLLKSNACRGELRTRVRGIVEGFWRLYTEDLGAIPVCLPSLDEQHEILQSIISLENRYKLLISNVEMQISLLREYRTRLISDVVTGQMDVRNIVIPEYTPENGTISDEIEDIEGEEVSENAD